MLSFSTSPRFAHVDRAELDRIEALVKLDQFAPGELIWAAGTPSDWLGIICDGAADLVVPGRDGDRVVATLGPGDLYGEVELFSELPTGTRLVAHTELLSRICPKNPLKQELRAHRTLAVGLLFAFSRSMSEKIRAANAALVTLRGDAPAASVPAPPRAASDRPPHLAEDEAHWISMLGRPTEAAAGEVLVREGDASRSFYVIESGTLEVRKAVGDGDSHLLATLGGGDLFGFMSFLDGHPRSASVVAAGGPATLVEIPADALDRALGLNFTVAFKFLGAMCQVLGRTFADTTREAARLAS